MEDSASEKKLLQNIVTTIHETSALARRQSARLTLRLRLTQVANVDTAWEKLDLLGHDYWQITFVPQWRSRENHGTRVSGTSFRLQHAVLRTDAFPDIYQFTKGISSMPREWIDRIENHIVEYDYDLENAVRKLDEPIQQRRILALVKIYTDLLADRVASSVSEHAVTQGELDLYEQLIEDIILDEGRLGFMVTDYHDRFKNSSDKLSRLRAAATKAANDLADTRDISKHRRFGEIRESLMTAIIETA